jgi:hypothetical protein
MRFVASLFFALGSAASAFAQEVRVVDEFDPQFAAWGRVLARVARPDGFDYAALRLDRTDFERAKLELAAVGAKEFETFSRPLQLAYLINAHNVFAIDRVLRAYPVKSINQTRRWLSPLEARDIDLLERRWSLRDLRRAAMDETRHDARAIFALNWAMRGCAPLSPVAPTEDNLDALLDRLTREFLRDPANVRHDRARRRIHVSRLLREERRALERDFTSLWKLLERYSEPEAAARIAAEPPKLVFEEMDEGLNDAKEGGGSGSPRWTN